MNWELIISALAGLITGGGASWLFRLKEDKAGSQADAIDASAEAMKKLLDIATHQQDVFAKMLDEKDKIIVNQQTLIEQYKSELSKAKDDLKELTNELKQERQKIANLEKLVNTKINR
jgi:hypothetical protein